MRNAGYVERHKKVSHTWYQVAAHWYKPCNWLGTTLFFETLRGCQLADAIPPRYSPVQHKPVFAEHLQVRANRVDARFANRKNKEMMLIEMSCPWMDNRKQKEEEKTLKYAPLRLELKRQHPGFKIRQFNIVIDALGGYSRRLKVEVKTLEGSDTYREVLRRMQKAVLSHILHIAKTFKVMC